MVNVRRNNVSIIQRGTFLALYIHHQVKMVRGEYSSVVSLLLPVVFMCGVGALHRYITFHNTAMDVFWGAVLGLAFALHAVSKIFRN